MHATGGKVVEQLPGAQGGPGDRLGQDRRYLLGGHRVGLGGPSALLGQQRRQAIPFGPAHTGSRWCGRSGGRAGGGHADFRGVVEHGSTSGMDDLVRGHGLGLLLVTEATEGAHPWPSSRSRRAARVTSTRVQEALVRRGSQKAAAHGSGSAPWTPSRNLSPARSSPAKARRRCRQPGRHRQDPPLHRRLHRHRAHVTHRCRDRSASPAGPLRPAGWRAGPCTRASRLSRPEPVTPFDRGGSTGLGSLPPRLPQRGIVSLLGLALPFYRVLEGGPLARDSLMSLQVLTPRLQTLHELRSAFVHYLRLVWSQTSDQRPSAVKLLTLRTVAIAFASSAARRLAGSPRAPGGHRCNDR